MEEKINLNVGGTSFTTFRDTLTRYPGSTLHSKFSKDGISTVPKDDSGRYFIDRDGSMFEFILNFLRSGNLNLPTDFTSYEQLIDEADYFQLPDMKKLILTRQPKQVMPVTVPGRAQRSAGSSSGPASTTTPIGSRSGKLANFRPMPDRTGDECTSASRNSNSDDPNEDLCAVCQDVGDLLCCETCPKVFHLQCHIPALQSTPNDSVSWSCTFCQAKEAAKEEGGQIRRRKRENRLTERERKLCERVLLGLFCEESSTSFWKPVSQDVPGYYDIITRPMDLSTIKDRLVPSNPDYYQSVDDMLSDLKLVFSNCFEYNGPEDSLSQTARTLQGHLKSLINRFLPDYETDFDGNDNTSEENRTGKRKRKSKDSVHIKNVNVNKAGGISNTEQKTKGKRKKRLRLVKIVSSSDEESDDETKTPPKKRRSTRTHDEKRWMKDCENLLNILFEKEFSKYFTTTTVFKNFFGVMKEPMDLTTVKERLEGGKYKGPDDFAKDIRLIVSNSKAYLSDKKAEIHTMTQEFSNFFNDNIRDILTTYNNAIKCKKLDKGNGIPSTFKKGKDQKQSPGKELTLHDTPGPSGTQKAKRKMTDRGPCKKERRNLDYYFDRAKKQKKDKDDSYCEIVPSSPSSSDDE